MADYKTTDYVIQTVLLLLSSITKPKYLKTSPANLTALEYIVINSLPINAAVMQKCHVNVNYHVRDIGEGRPDVTKIEAGSIAVLAILKSVTSATYLIDFESQETIREVERGEHYSNLRFSFKQINY